MHITSTENAALYAKKANLSLSTKLKFNKNFKLEAVVVASALDDM